MKYWQTYQKNLIQNFLNHIADNKIEFTLWQQEGSTRRQYDAKLISNDKTRCKIKVSKSSIEENGNIDKLNPIFIHIPSIDIIFKKEKYNLFTNEIDFPPPIDIQVYERRAQQRFYFKYQDHKNITFYSENLGLNTDEPEFVCPCVLIDISVSGAGIIITKEVKQKIAMDKILFLQDITDQKLPIPFKVEVMYIEPYKNEEDSNLYKLGINFVEDLDSISYKSITSLIEKKQERTKGIDPNRFCGLSFEEQTKVLNKIDITNKQLSSNIKDNIEQLDKLRYLTTQMKIEFLQVVEHDLLATALRLSSKELIYELFTELTDNMKTEFLDKLEIEGPASSICKAQDKIIELIRQKEASGEYVLDPTSFITYV
jgi:DNA-directed RNA polymerase subunit H (RpoH/RPB5)